jgi:hypothetical protein
VGDAQVDSGQGVMEDTQFDYERRFSVFPFTLRTFLPLYTSRGLWKYVSVHSDR